MKNRILVVDDDKFQLQKISIYLHRQGFNVVAVLSSKVALNLFLLDHFDLVVTDCDMPEMDGLHLTKRIRDEGKDTPIFMISASESAKDVFLENAGGTAFFRKEELKEMAEKIIALLKA